jgi:hypothetical protein
VPRFEHHFEVTEMADNARSNIETLAAQVRAFGDEGWELVYVGLGVDVERFGKSDVLAFKRARND